MDSGARVTTVNSSGASRVSPKVRDSELSPQPLSKTRTVTGAVSLKANAKRVMVTSLPCRLCMTQDPAGAGSVLICLHRLGLRPGHGHRRYPPFRFPPPTLGPG